MEGIDLLYQVITQRKNNISKKSYTNYLFEQGSDKILKKIGEEACELVIASKNKDKEEIVNEACDLIYHILVNLVNEDVDLEHINNELLSRANKSGNLKNFNSKGEL